MMSAGDVARYRAGTASLLATSVEEAGEIERWLDSGADGGEGGSPVQAWLSENPKDASSALAAPPVILLRQTRKTARTLG